MDQLCKTCQQTSPSSQCVSQGTAHRLERKHTCTHTHARTFLLTLCQGVKCYLEVIAISFFFPPYKTKQKNVSQYSTIIQEARERFIQVRQ